MNKRQRKKAWKKFCAARGLDLHNPHHLSFATDVVALAALPDDLQRLYRAVASHLVRDMVTIISRALAREIYARLYGLLPPDRPDWLGRGSPPAPSTPPPP